MTARQCLIGCYYKWTLRSYTACQTVGEIDKVSWYFMMDWGRYHGIWPTVKVVTGILSLCFRTSGVLECDWQYSGGEGNIFVWAGVDLELRPPLSRTESNWPLVMTTFLIITGFVAEALVTVQSPSLPKRWQHWVTEKDLAASTPVARWLVLPRCEDFVLIRRDVFWLWSKLLNDTVTLRARAWNRCLRTRRCCSVDSSIHILTKWIKSTRLGERCRKKGRNWSMRRGKVKNIGRSRDREVAFLRQAQMSNSSGL